ncbi:hypothetical protein ACHAWF_014096, partial [Thalassiosira exigua]
MTNVSYFPKLLLISNYSAGFPIMIIQTMFYEIYAGFFLVVQFPKVLVAFAVELVDAAAYVRVRAVQ